MMNANNVVVFDNRGIPSIMVKFENPKAAVTPPMFVIGGKEVDAIYISKYPNVVIDGRAYSLPWQDPTVNIDFDEVVRACRAKGEGWHLTTAVEWEYILDESREKDTMPHGNTDWGNNYYDKSECGKIANSNWGRTLTGSGPATWNHDHTVYGVSDINGNVWEWLAGLRLMDGKIERMPNNDAALFDIDFSKDSEDWKAFEINGNKVRYKVDGGEIYLTEDTEENEQDYDGVPWKELQVELLEVPEELKSLGLVPKGKKDNEAYIWIDTDGERLPFRGSSFFSTSNSGPSALGLSIPRSDSDSSVGFRSAFYEVNGKLVTE